MSNTHDDRVIIEIRPEDVVRQAHGWLIAHGVHWCAETGIEMNGARKARIVA
jgi:hypothetical protein